MVVEELAVVEGVVLVAGQAEEPEAEAASGVA